MNTRQFFTFTYNPKQTFKLLNFDSVVLKISCLNLSPSFTTILGTMAIHSWGSIIPV